MPLERITKPLMALGLLTLVVIICIAAFGWHFRTNNVHMNEALVVGELEKMGCKMIRVFRYPKINEFEPKQIRPSRTNVVVGVEIPIESTIPNYSKRVAINLQQLTNLEYVSLTGSVMILAPPGLGKFRIDSQDLASLDIVVRKWMID